MDNPIKNFVHFILKLDVRVCHNGMLQLPIIGRLYQKVVYTIQKLDVIIQLLGVDFKYTSGIFSSSKIYFSLLNAILCLMSESWGQIIDIAGIHANWNLKLSNIVHVGARTVLHMSPFLLPQHILTSFWHGIKSCKMWKLNIFEKETYIFIF